ncbi:MAG: hypothetical protein AUK55_13995 [Syntrophobacteraceae bacterium CG2_30_61_12]|nr:MAG: hypothetical protein AUK55_13995 [Syntrophobacteraceae bacterium CG2_30_61_12]
MPKPEAQKLFTYRDYSEWDEGRYELINGVVHDMTPAPSRIHQEVSIQLLRQLLNRLDRQAPCKVYVAPFEVRFPDADEADHKIRTVVQPDLAVICDSSKLDDRGCRGAPDWIIEIVSPSTASQDYIRKLALYEKYGVREYWIVHPTDRIAMVYTMAEDGRYGRAKIYSAEDRVEAAVIEGLVIDLGEVFAS